jgi:hypothetical protein
MRSEDEDAIGYLTRHDERVQYMMTPIASNRPATRRAILTAKRRGTVRSAQVGFGWQTHSKTAKITLQYILYRLYVSYDLRIAKQIRWTF